MTAVRAGEVTMEAREAAPLPAQGRRPLRKLWRLKWGVAAAAMMLVIVLITLAAPWIAPYSPVEVDIRHRLGPPAWMEGGKVEHLLGTDQIGRDLLSRMI